MNNKIIAISTVIMIVSVITVTYATKQSINPLAMLAAIIVIVAGLAWFRKTTKIN